MPSASGACGVKNSLPVKTDRGVFVCAAMFSICGVISAFIAVELSLILNEICSPQHMPRTMVMKNISVSQSRQTPPADRNTRTTAPVCEMKKNKCSQLPS